MKRIIYAIIFFSLCITLILFIGYSSENTNKSKEATLGQGLQKLIKEVRDIQKEMYTEIKLKKQNRAFDNIEFGEDVDTVKRKLNERAQQYEKIFGAAARLKISEAKYSMHSLR